MSTALCFNAEQEFDEILDEFEEQAAKNHDDDYEQIYEEDAEQDDPLSIEISENSEEDCAEETGLKYIYIIIYNYNNIIMLHY